MKNKKILSIIMLVVLLAGIAGVVYGTLASDKNIYADAAKAVGCDKQKVKTYFEDPKKLTKVGDNNDISQIGTEYVKEYLIAAGVDAEKVNNAIVFPAATEKAKDSAEFLVYMQIDNPEFTEENLNDLINNQKKEYEAKQIEMIMKELGIEDKASYDATKTESNEALLELYREAIQKKNAGKQTTDAILAIGIILIVCAVVFFIAQIKQKKIRNFVMLGVLIIGFVCAIYGALGNNIYNNAAEMMGGDKKAAMTSIQDPSKLTKLGNNNDITKIGPDNIKAFLKELGADAAKVDEAVDQRLAFQMADQKAKNKEEFVAYMQKTDPSFNEDARIALVKSDRNKHDELQKQMVMDELGIMDAAAYKALDENTALIALYREVIPQLQDDQHMTSAVVVQYVGIIIIVGSLAYFLIQAMDIKPRARTKAANPKVTKVMSFLLNYALFIIMGLILVVVSIIKIDFLSMTNILNILQNASTKGILALGCAGLIVLAGTDLSIGRVLGISAAVTASLVQTTTYTSRMYPTMIDNLGGFGLLIPLLASIAVAVAFCLINGFGVAKLHLHAFIVTLGTQLIAYGANCLFIESQPSGTAQSLSTFNKSFLSISAGAIEIAELRIPLVVIYFVVLACIMWVIWNKTKLGKDMFAVGGNTEAAAVSGVNVAKTIMLVYLMAGVLYGIAAFLEAGRITTVGTATGLNYETDAISAVVVGGVSFSGGVGTIQGVVIGAVILQAIVYALQFLGVNPYIQYIIRGLIIILAVSIDVRKYIVKK